MRFVDDHLKNSAANISPEAKIPIFVTGGIGGVHRGDAWDVTWLTWPWRRCSKDVQPEFHHFFLCFFLDFGIFQGFLPGV